MSFRSKDSSMILVKDYEFKNPYIRDVWNQNDSRVHHTYESIALTLVTQHPLKNNKFSK